MASMEGVLHLVSLLLLVLISSVMSKKTYIVQMKQHTKPSAFLTHEGWYLSSLRSVNNNNKNNNADLIYAYTHACKGFAATLEPEHAEALKQSGAVLGLYEDVKYEPHTTRTPQLLKVDDEFGLWEEDGGAVNANGKFPEVIIGVIDTGITPESKSFSDDGIPEVPEKWKGVCVNASDFDPSKHCNRKLIGATYYVNGLMADLKIRRVNFTDVISPRDYQGHGTHTASTAAGSPVPNASLFGHANGTARGMAPHARVAAYKVCWTQGCMGTDILAAMDQAIKDGVDVISMSVGGGADDRYDYHLSPTAIGAFGLMEHGIFLSASAGNGGPSYKTLTNGAPWIMTVGSSSIDREFPVYVTLGNKQRFRGFSISPTDISGRRFPLVYAKESNASKLCIPNSLDPRVVRGKVVICDSGGEFSNLVLPSQVVLEAGGVGMIICSTHEFGFGTSQTSPAFMLPSALVGSKDGDLIKNYAMSDPNPMATLTFIPQLTNVKPWPVLAQSSSRGPYHMSPQILKPDVVGPGVAILAACQGTSPSTYPFDTRKAEFTIMSGTSMSCPHISGVAALLKAAHPDWSPSAIKSALMTTAYVDDRTKLPIRDQAGNPADPWALGAGHINPSKAVTPGLVYDITPQDYVKFLCSLNFTTLQVQQISRNQSFTCSEKFADPGDLNYPSFVVRFYERNNFTYGRELTNVGAEGLYKVAIQAPPTVSIKITPRRLVFKDNGEKVKYQITFVSRGNETQPVAGSITWTNGKQRVRSQIVFMWNKLI